MSKLSLSYPDTGLIISISVKNRDTGIEEFSGVMTEVSKVYKYDFVEVANTDYIYVATCTGYDDMTGVIYSDSTTSGGLTTEEHDKLFSLENSTGGGGFSSQAIQTSISNAKKAIMDRIDELKPTDITEITDKLNETNSHIDIVKTDILDTIKSTENEVCSDIIRKSKEIKEDNVKTRNLIRDKYKKHTENILKIADRQELIDKSIERQAEEIETELEEIYKKEAENIEQEMEDQFKQEAEEIEKSLNS